MLQHKLQFIYRGGKTKRYHTEETIKPQNVAEHSFGVAWLTTLLMPKDKELRPELILAALAHDLAEHKVGDVPSPTKKAHPVIGDAIDLEERRLLAQNNLSYEVKLDEFELRVLKVADMCDGMMFCVNEERLGNRNIIEVWNNFNEYAASVPNLWPEAIDLIMAIKSLWGKSYVSKY